MPYEKCPNANEGCKYWDGPSKVPGEDNGCFADVHHYWWPKDEYRQGLARRVRESAQFKQLTCRVIHEAFHADPPPIKPDPAELRAILASQEGSVNVAS